jgi:hypothetical protein
MNATRVCSLVASLLQLLVVFSFHSPWPATRTLQQHWQLRAEDDGDNLNNLPKLTQVGDSGGRKVFVDRTNVDSILNEIMAKLAPMSAPAYTGDKSVSEAEVNAKFASLFDSVRSQPVSDNEKQVLLTETKLMIEEAKAGEIAKALDKAKITTTIHKVIFGHLAGSLLLLSGLLCSCYVTIFGCSGACADVILPRQEIVE